jgi:hypothetical protein
LVACTAHVTPEIDKKCKESGFDFVAHSPLSMEMIVDVILKELIARRLNKFEHSIIPE